MADYLDKNTAETEKLVNEALKGDVSAFGAVVEQHWNMVLALAMSKVADAAEAEDKVALKNRLQDFMREEYTKLQGSGAEEEGDEGESSEWKSSMEKVAEQLEMQLEVQSETKEEDGGAVKEGGEGGA